MMSCWKHWDRTLSERMCCSKEERGRILEVIRKLVYMCREVRHNGILWLETAADKEEDVFLRSCLRYITAGGAEAEDLQGFASIWLLTAQEDGARLLEMAVIADGLEQLLREKTPELLWRRLGAWLGADFADTVEAEIAAMEQKRLDRQWAARMERHASLVPAFDALADLPIEDLSRLLQGTDMRTLTLALMGAGGCLLDKVARSAPALWADAQKEASLLQAPRPCDVRAAQTQILREIDQS